MEGGDAMTDEPTRTAFVIMPFSEDFQPVYDLFIKPGLEAAGLQPIRADDIRSQRNILQDIVEGIETTALVVADLTDSNPNVFYELGLAHALERPVILLTQSLDDVPFDLQSYRLITYDVHFARIEEARAELEEYAVGFVNDTVRFSSPISDFRAAAARSGASRGGLPVRTPTETDDDLGLLDHMELIETSYGELRRIIDRITEITESVSASTVEAGEQLERTQKAHDRIPYAHLRRISHGLSEDVDSFTTELKELNSEYSQTAREVSDSLEFIVTYPGAVDQESKEDVVQFVQMLTSIRQQGADAAKAYDHLADTMDSVPPFEKGLTRTLRTASHEARETSDNIEITLSSLDRAIVAAQELLDAVEASKGESGLKTATTVKT